MRLCVRIIKLRNQYKITEHDRDNPPIDYSANIYLTIQPTEPNNRQVPKLVQFLSLTHGVNDDQLIQLVRISCPRPEAQLNSSSLTRLCLIMYISTIPPQLYLFITRIFVIWHRCLTVACFYFYVYLFPIWHGKRLSYTSTKHSLPPTIKNSTIVLQSSHFNYNSSHPRYF